MTDETASEHQEIYQFHSLTSTPPQRLVSLVPSMTESLFDLNLGSRLVGITDYCIFPEDGVRNLPRVGGTKNPDIERIISLNPDLVLMNKEENRLKDAEALQAAGLTVWATHPTTVREALNVLWDIMSICDEPSMSERVRWIERQLDWTAGAAQETTPVRAFVPIWHNPWMTFTRKTFMHDLLRVCGGENVFATYSDETAYPRISLEEIVAAQPEVVLLPSEPYAFTTEHAALLAEQDIPAAHHLRIHLVDGTLLTWHGTRIAYALSEIPPLLAVQKEE